MAGGGTVVAERGKAGRWRRAAALTGAALLALAACGRAPIASSPPAVAPAAAVDAARPDATAPGHVASLRVFYAKVESDLTASGRLRRDVAPADAPYGVDDLVRNFERVALFEEYADVDGRFVRSETPATLRRWAGPVRVGVMTGPSSPPGEAARDRANVAAFTQRLKRLTDADLAMSEGADVNFLVLFMDSAERLAFAERVAERYPEFAPAVVGMLRDTPLDMFCNAYAFGEPRDPAVYSAVIVVIRAEHPPLTRLSCVNEEMAQAMGLPNDSPEARPSLFNDSLEFALLTRHDETLLRMLYDPRLRPGMTAEEARPLLPAIAADALAREGEPDGAVALTN